MSTINYRRRWRDFSRRSSEPTLRVIDLGLRDASDREIWRHASEANIVLITKDGDLTNMSVIAPTAAVVWVRIGNCRRAYLLDVFRRVWPRIVDRLESGDRLVEVQ